MEDNEWSFCSMWTEQIRSGCIHALFNGRLAGDYFFNRVDVSNCPDPILAANQIARIFWQKDVDCYLHDNNDKLAGKGLAELDTMHVLASSTDGTNGKAKTLQIGHSLLPIWVDVFCRSFAVPQWKTEVSRIMDVNFDKLELMLSYSGDMPAGCAALYKKNGVTGLYCLGTLFQSRKRGFARDMLKRVMTKNLFLQTLGSEKLLTFYEKSGFTVAYTKKIYVLRHTTKKGHKNQTLK